ncbi:hypothetical protein J6590_056855 [Homalodisca vitripennis]|nr:hypothetical protein J6590_056855 [Homalodisca vitripennis]
MDTLLTSPLYPLVHPRQINICHDCIRVILLETLLTSPLYPLGDSFGDITHFTVVSTGRLPPRQIDICQDCIRVILMDTSLLRLSTQ